MFHSLWIEFKWNIPVSYIEFEQSSFKNTVAKDSWNCWSYFKKNIGLLAFVFLYRVITRLCFFLEICYECWIFVRYNYYSNNFRYVDNSRYADGSTVISIYFSVREHIVYFFNPNITLLSNGTSYDIRFKCQVNSWVGTVPLKCDIWFIIIITLFPTTTGSRLFY